MTEVPSLNRAVCSKRVVGEAADPSRFRRFSESLTRVPGAVTSGASKIDDSPDKDERYPAFTDVMGDSSSAISLERHRSPGPLRPTAPQPTSTSA